MYDAVFFAAVQAIRAGMDLNPANLDIRGTYTTKSGKEGCFRLADFDDEEFDDAGSLAGIISRRLSAYTGRYGCADVAITQIAA